SSSSASHSSSTSSSSSSSPPRSSASSLSSSSSSSSSSASHSSSTSSSSSSTATSAASSTSSSSIENTIDDSLKLCERREIQRCDGGVAFALAHQLKQTDLLTPAANAGPRVRYAELHINRIAIGLRSGYIDYIRNMSRDKFHEFHKGEKFKEIFRALKI